MSCLLVETKWHRADSELQELRKREAANKDQHERARHKWENSIDALANELAAVVQSRYAQQLAEDSAAAEPVAGRLRHVLAMLRRNALKLRSD